MDTLQSVDIKTHPLQGISLIEASAGTGKTYTITHLYVRALLESECSVEQILVVTFTNAATQELKQRIQQLIYEVRDYVNGSRGQSDQLDSFFSQYIGDPAAKQKLAYALINFDEAAIYSIHGFCQRVLNTFPIETHSLLQQQIISNEKELMQQAITDYWRKNVIKLHTDKLRWLLSHWAAPDNLLKDIEPLMEFEALIAETEKKLQIKLKELNIEETWQQLTGLWQKDKAAIRALLVDSKALNRSKIRKPSVEKLLELLAPYFAESCPYHLLEKWELITATKLKECQNQNQDDAIDLEFFVLTEVFQKKHTEWVNGLKKEILVDAAKQVFEEVQQKKKDAQNISFNDLIKQLSVELENNQTLPAKIRQLYPIAMVDEFQDTDFRQYGIFKTLYQSEEAGSALILIGDPKQAIYSFRGADVFTYQMAKADTQKQYTLDVNYRSSEEYIAMVNEIFQHNSQAFILDQLISFMPANAAKKQMQILEYEKPAAPMVCWMLEYVEKGSSKAEATEYFAQCCAQEIHQILNDQTLKIDGKACSASDLTILVKTGFQASTMQNKLANLGIKSALQTRESVFETDQAREITLLMEVLIDPTNVSRICGLLSTDIFGWNAAQIFELQQNSQLLTELLEQFKAYQIHWNEKGFLSMLFQLMKDSNSLNVAHHMEGERRITNWLHIAELLQQESQSHASQNQLLQWLVQQREWTSRVDNESHQLRLESDKNLVHIVTIHRSKGLQYPVVFMPFMWNVKELNNKQSCYHYHNESGDKKVVLLDDEFRDQWQSEAEAEEVRLFYVGITRAQYRCYIGWGHINGAGSSAIAHCLYPQKIKSGKHPKQLNLENEQELYAPFEHLNRQHKLVEIVRPSIFKTSPNKTEADVTQSFSAKVFSRHIKQLWRISSYSQIATTGHKDHAHRPDYDALTTSIPAEIIDLEKLDQFSFQKGAKAGNLLHDILEHQVFNQPVSEPLILQKCQEYGFDEKWVPCLVEWISQILDCDLGHFKLAQLTSDQTLAEMEFYLSCNQLKAPALNRLLLENDYIQAAQHLDFVKINGFLKGFIDLVFELDNQYYIADYKSNYLGDDYSAYSVETCRQAMFDHHYHLQYLIYSLALHRYLKTRIKDYDYKKDFGGVYYLFLRGMSATKSSEKSPGFGVYFHKPEYRVIQQLDGLFS